MTSESFHLPPLRSDLVLNKNIHAHEGGNPYTIYDPLHHAYHALNQKTFSIIQHWQAGDSADFIAALSHHDDIEATSQDLKTIVEFLFQHGLADSVREGATPDLIKAYKNKKRAGFKKAMHAYVFFRIPLVRPQAFLDNTARYVNFLFHPVTWMLLGCIALIAFYLVSQQWTVFISTFFGLLTPEGLIGYALAIILTKIAHELGHAYAAHRYGCKVTSLGIGIMLMFPILYADTTDAWRLTSRRKRLVIGGAGMAAELVIAIFATLAWSLLTDGPVRSIAFFLATTSWIMTILVNLNPLMRFDGYYLLSDALNFQNLQPRSNALGRWWLRELLFGARVPCPETLSPPLHRGLIVYAVCVWIYRFFLFLGIALILHAVAVKLIATLLSIIEIGWFIVRPVLMEISHWPNLFRQGRLARQSGFVLSTCVLVIMTFIPWQSTIHAPAVIKPAAQATIYTGLPAQIRNVSVTEGQFVQAGTPLISLSSPALEVQVVLIKEQINLLEARINRRATDTADRAEGAILARQLAGEQQRLQGFMALKDDLIIRAPIDGYVNGISSGLRQGLWVNPSLALMTIAKPGMTLASAFVSETNIDRIIDTRTARFYADDPLIPPITFSMDQISPTGSRTLEEPLVSSTQGGALGVRENSDGKDVPINGVFRVLMTSTHSQSSGPSIDRPIRGIMRLEGQRKSPAENIIRRAVAIINRETLS